MQAIISTEPAPLAFGGVQGEPGVCLVFLVLYFSRGIPIIFTSSKAFGDMDHDSHPRVGLHPGIEQY
jgi:hypothetical protein